MRAAVPCGGEPRLPLYDHRLSGPGDQGAQLGVGVLDLETQAPENFPENLHEAIPQRALTVGPGQLDDVLLGRLQLPCLGGGVDAPLLGELAHPRLEIPPCFLQDALQPLLAQDGTQAGVTDLMAQQRVLGVLDGGEVGGVQVDLALEEDALEVDVGGKPLDLFSALHHGDWDLQLLDDGGQVRLDLYFGGGGCAPGASEPRLLYLRLVERHVLISRVSHPPNTLTHDPVESVLRQESVKCLSGVPEAACYKPVRVSDIRLAFGPSL